jgi:hypothetical protein
MHVLLREKRWAVLGNLLIVWVEGPLTAVAGASCSGGSGDNGGGVGGGNDLAGGLGEDAVKGLRPERRIVGLCVIVWGAVRVMAAFCLRLTACTAKAEAIKQWCSLRETK